MVRGEWRVEGDSEGDDGDYCTCFLVLLRFSLSFLEEVVQSGHLRDQFLLILFNLHLLGSNMCVCVCVCVGDIWDMVVTEVVQLRSANAH